MKTEKVVYTVMGRGFIEYFNDRNTAKLIYKILKECDTDAVLYKTISTVETLEFNDDSECWL